MENQQADTQQTSGETPRRRLRWILPWAVSAVLGVGAALLIWWMLLPYAWFWKYEADLDSADDAKRDRAIAFVAARQDERSRDVVDAWVRPWLDAPDDRRFVAAFKILSAHGRFPGIDARPELHVRIARILYLNATASARVAILAGLERLRGEDQPNLLQLLLRGVNDEDPDVQSQAVWTAIRLDCPQAGIVLSRAMASKDDVLASLAVSGLLWLDDRSDATSLTGCIKHLLDVIDSDRSSNLRSDALFTASYWMSPFSDTDPVMARVVRDSDEHVAGTAVFLTSDMDGGHAWKVARETLGRPVDSLLTVRAAMLVARLGLNQEAHRLRHWIYNADRADVREAAAAALGKLEFEKKAEALATMLANAVLEPGTSLDLALLDAMRESIRRKRPAKPPRRWIDLLVDICSKIPTDAPDTLPTTLPATTRAAVLTQQPMVACEAAILLSEWDADAARKFLWLQMGSPIVEIRDRAAVAMGRVLDDPYGEMLRADLTSFSVRRRCAAALALAGDRKGLDEIARLLPRQREHPVAELYFRGALWIGGRDAHGQQFRQWVQAKDIAPMSRMRIALLARSAEGLEMLLTDERDPRWSVDPEQLDEFFQATRMFELLGKLLADWGKPGLEYDPFADKAWRVAQCRRMGIWYQVHRDRLVLKGGRLVVE